MKSKRRHELQQNVLDAELGKVIAFARRHLIPILGVAIGLLAVILVTILVWRSYQASSVKPQEEFFALQTKKNSDPNASPADLLKGFEALTNQTSDRQVAAYSCLEIASMAAAKSLVATTSELKKQAEDQAAIYYKKVNDQYADIPDALARAKQGLGRLAEAKRDLETARAEYEQALKVCPQGVPFREEISQDLRRVQDDNGAPRMLYNDRRPTPTATSLPTFQAIP